MSPDSNFEDFYTSYKEKMAPLQKQPPSQSNWTFIITIIIGIALWGLFIFAYTRLYPGADIDLLVIVQTLFLTFTVYFIIFSFFGIYHMVRFGFEGDLSAITTIIYVILAASLLYVSAVLIF